MPKYAVVIESSGSSYGVSSPDVPGCISVAETRDEALHQYAEALAMHLRGMREDGASLPEPSASVEYVEVELGEPVAAG